MHEHCQIRVDSIRVCVDYLHLIKIIKYLKIGSSWAEAEDICVETSFK